MWDIPINRYLWFPSLAFCAGGIAACIAIAVIQSAQAARATKGVR